MGGEILDARGVPVRSKPAVYRSQAAFRANGSRYCACGVKISANAHMCFRCTKNRQFHHEGAIVTALAAMSKAEREKKLALITEGQRTALRAKIEEYLEDRAARFKPGRG